MKDIETIAESLEAFDTRLSSIDGRFVNVEGHLADGARAGEETSRNFQKLSELYLRLDSRLENIEKLLGNYVEATKERSAQARKAEEAAQSLISYVRRRFPEAAEG